MIGKDWFSVATGPQKNVFLYKRALQKCRDGACPVSEGKGTRRNQKATREKALMVRALKAPNFRVTAGA
jgi:hypothetical protein